MVPKNRIQAINNGQAAFNSDITSFTQTASTAGTGLIVGASEDSDDIDDTATVIAIGAIFSEITPNYADYPCRNSSFASILKRRKNCHNVKFFNEIFFGQLLILVTETVITANKAVP